jgi:hypothetical protein
MVQDARKFQYSSDYPQPLVTYRNQITLNAPTGETETLIKVAHGLPYVPLFLGKVSEYSDFRTCQDITSEVGSDSNTTFMWADATYFYFIIFHQSNVAVTEYVRVVAFVPPDYTGDISLVTNDTKFRFNSDYDYVGLYKQGTLEAGSQTVVSHDLGYAPQCRAWTRSNVYIPDRPDIDFYAYGTVSPGITTYTNSGVTAFSSVATNSEYIIARRSDGQEYLDKTYYHIYTLEA